MKFRNSVNILRESWSVLKLDRELIWFPIMSGIALVAVLVTIFSAFIIIPVLNGWGSALLDSFGAEGDALSLLHVLSFALLYVVYAIEYFVVIYFNTALVSCALIRFEGGDPTISDGIRQANSRLKQIVGWTLLSAGIGTILSAIEERLGFVGKIVINLIGAGWTIATYFVVPVLAAEGLGPIHSVKRSVALLKKSWGEGLIGNVSIGLVTFATCSVIIVASAGLIYLADYLDSTLFLIGAILLTIFALLSVVVINSALHQIFLAGLYKFASSGEVPNGFSEGSMTSALKTK
ncbi:MAG: hypothetical protein HQ472_05640 [Ignavibacteria bacterium]|nr:hypothetical protein [Ignavibacteria bacterium]